VCSFKIAQNDERKTFTCNAISMHELRPMCSLAISCKQFPIARKYSAGGNAMAETLLHVNGADHHLQLAEDEMLLYVLRDRLNLTGTKYGCGEGQCGACTVLIEGRPVRSCQTLATGAAGRKITTIEGLESNGRLHRVQQAFIDEEAFQCAYCTPGMIMSAVGLLASNPKPRDEEIIRGMNGNICRCGTYQRILAAVRRAAGETPKIKAELQDVPVMQEVRDEL
jgi:aerobic-type carbon monoxide dehydrogenase small subunit (CoxS/CutS family)